MESIDAVIERISYLGEDRGPCGRAVRFRALIPEVFARYLGSVVEIGAGEGASTAIFLEVAHSHSRSVLVVDPWQEAEADDPRFTVLRETSGLPDVSRDRHFPGGYGGYRFDVFFANVQKYAACLHVCSRPSSHPLVPEALSEVAPIAFCFIDGLQLKDAVLQDLHMLTAFRPPVICVDDFGYVTGIQQVPLAIEEFLRDAPYRRAPRPVSNHEGYLVLYEVE